MRSRLRFTSALVASVALINAAACGNTAPQSQPAPASAPAAAPATADTAPAAVPAPPPPPVPVALEVAVPAGTALSLTLSTPVASDKSRAEDRVAAKLRTAVTVAGHEAFPAGADVVGIVTLADPSGRVKGKAHLALRFEEIRFDGKAYKIDARVSLEAESSKGSDIKKGAIGGVAGAVVGGILGGKKGAVIGGVAGAGGTVLATTGKEVELGSGARLTPKLRSAVTVTVK